MDRKKQTRRVTQAATEGGKVYYLVNPGGAIHETSRELAAEWLREPGWRIATDEEVAELKRRNGHQTADHPICNPISDVQTEVSSD